MVVVTWDEVFGGLYEVTAGPLDTPCFLATFGKCAGYGWIRNPFDGRPQVYAHRLSFRLTHGHDGGTVRHRCDVKTCIRPEHLIDGTAADNMRDAVERGLLKRGAQRRNARLTEAKVVKFFERHVTGETVETIAHDLGVSAASLHHVRAGKTWTHVATPHRSAVVGAPRRTKKLGDAGAAEAKRLIADGHDDSHVARRLGVGPRSTGRSSPPACRPCSTTSTTGTSM